MRLTPSTQSKIAALTLLSLLALLPACGETVEGDSYTTASPAPLNSEVYIDVETFEDYRAEGATVLDVRSLEDYEQGHVPGAIKSSWEDFRDADRDGAFIERDPGKLAEAAGNLGITRDDKVLIYGGSQSTLPSRQAWSIEYIGHGDVYILDGGLPAWNQQTDVDLSTDTPDVQPTDYAVGTRDSILATGDQVQQALESDDPVVIFDARSQSEYEGTDDRDNPRHGHVPDAINYNWKNVYNDDGTLRPKSEIRSELKSKGLLKEGAVIIPYCQGGFRSAVVYTVLRWLGRTNVKNYDGSWYQYSRKNDWEVEQN